MKVPYKFKVERLVHSNQKGFGLLIVFTTLLMVSLFVTYIISSNIEFLSVSQLSETEAKVEVLRRAINKYKSHHLTAVYVTTVGPPSILSNLVNDTGDVCVGDNVVVNASYLTLQGWCGPYVDQKISENLLDYQTDGWGNLLNYNSATEIIVSIGPNGTDEAGGGDDLIFNP